MSGDFSAFLKKKEEKGEETPKPKKTKGRKKTKEEKVAEKREELGAEVISDEAAEAIVEKEEAAVDASEKKETKSDREDDTEKKATKGKPLKPAKKPSVPKPPKAKETDTPSPSTPKPSPAVAESTPREVYTSEDLRAKVLVSDFGGSPDDSGYGGKVSITVVGDKGGGKSTLALSFTGTKLVVTYDRMTEYNKFKMRDPNKIKIIDPMPLLDSTTPLRKRDTYVKIFDFLVGVEEYPNGPRHGGLLDTHEQVDWVIHDGTDILMTICEMVMRHRNDLLPSQGVEWTLWKERKDAIQAVFNKSLTLAKKGVIFTTYFTEKQLDEDITGQKKTKEMPKWMDIILYQTLHTFVAQSQQDNYFLFVQQSKSIKKDVSRRTYDITGTPTEEEVKGETVYGMDFTKLYEVIERIEREVF
jgi:hypothetical protein